MDKNPFFHFKNFIAVKAKLPVLFSAVFIFIAVSCQNSAPKVSKVYTKVVYDYENEDSFPVQKFSFFLQMDSDVRRIDSIQLYHKETGYRWVINNPLITKSDNTFYAGYTNCSSSSQDNFLIPKGAYSVCHIDSQGREAFSEFNLDYDESASSKHYGDIKEILDAENAILYIGVYSQDGELIYYGLPDKKWNVTKTNLVWNSDAVFKDNKNSAFFRIFYDIENCIYIAPKIMKSE